MKVVVVVALIVAFFWVEITNDVLSGSGGVAGAEDDIVPMAKVSAI